MALTIAERLHVSKEKKKALSSIAKVYDHTDIINLIQTDRFDCLDLDLCGGLFTYMVNAIEQNKDWRLLMLTCTNKPRSKYKREAVAKGGLVQVWVFDWCKRNGWNCALEPIPYERGSRGLTFYTFVITRT